MSYRAAIYILAVLVVGFGSTVVAIAVPELDFVMPAIAQLALAVLTFPLGFLALSAGSLGIFLGLATPAESILVSTPLCAALGYIQWFRLLSYLYRRSG